MSYLPVTLNHFRAVKKWADSCDALVTLDVKSFNLEVKSRNRYYTLKPRFLMLHDGKMAYTTQLVKDVTGFIGWLPYDILQWDLSQDKLLAKNFFQSSGLKFPAAWSSLKDAEGDFLVKDSVGSFGYQIAGPYRQVEDLSLSSTQHTRRPKKEQGVEFAELFVCGTNLKVWFWGEKAFYANLHAYPTIVGDGLSTVQTLVESRLGIAGKTLNIKSDEDGAISSLAFQHVQLSDVLDQGREVWIDFRYGRRYLPTSFTAETDNNLSGVSLQVRQQIDLAGAKMAEEAMRRFKAPVLYSIDGVVDAEGTVWWLEINSNPMLPPEGYQLMFSSLFGLTQKSSE